MKLTTAITLEAEIPELPPPPVVRPSRNMFLSSAIEDILRDHRPAGLHHREIYRALQQRGFLTEPALVSRTCYNMHTARKILRIGCGIFTMKGDSSNACKPVDRRAMHRMR